MQAAEIFDLVSSVNQGDDVDFSGTNTREAQGSGGIKEPRKQGGFILPGTNEGSPRGCPHFRPHVKMPYLRTACLDAPGSASASSSTSAAVVVIMSPYWLAASAASTTP